MGISADLATETGATASREESLDPCQPLPSVRNPRFEDLGPPVVGGEPRVLGRSPRPCRFPGPLHVLSRSLLGAIEIPSNPFPGSANGLTESLLRPVDHVGHEHGEGDADAKDGDQFRRHAFVPSSMSRLTE